MGTSIIRAADSGALARALADRFATTVADPFAGEVVVVPTRGIERYLTQTIADQAGICAAIDFPSPRELLERVTGGGDPWQPDRLVWPRLATIDAHLAEPWAQPLAEHLRDEPGWRRSDRRLAVARRLAALFDAYAMQRPAMVRRWDAGEPADVPDDLRWQYQLWQAVRATVGSGPLDREPDATGLPERIAVFGPTQLPERFLGALRDLARHREVELYLPVASPTLWDAPGWSTAVTRTDDTSRGLATHPLLRSLGRDARELRQRLGARGRTVGPGATDAPPTQLRRLQSEIAANLPSSLRGSQPDASLQVHACHGPLRQVEVLLEVLLTLLHEDRTLQPRDIIIMTPDLDTYAPLLAAVFTAPDRRVRDLRLSIADRTPEQHNEVLLALDATLALLNGRMRRSEVLDLLKLAPVRGRFGLSAEDVVRLEELAEAARVRWGLDAANRTELGAGGSDLGTWSWGLDRMALGAAMADEPLAIVGDALPLPDLGSGDVGPVGRLAVLIGRLAALHRQVQHRRSLAEWDALLQQLISDLTAVGRADLWQETRARGAVESFVGHAGDDATVELSLADVRHMLASVLAGRPTRAGFRLGGVTACRLEPMRSVPHRVVALLGMDDGAFPRGSGRDGDDVLLRAARIGERDPRSEDRQLLLDAIMAARQHLVITYSGHDERTNEARRPAVPIAELLDLLPAHPTPVHRHPLQPFDPRNFHAAAAFSHDEAALAGARVSVQPRRGHQFLATALPAPEPPPHRSLDSLARFLTLPAATFFEQRLGVRPPREDEEIDELVPIGLSGLAKYQVGEPLLQALVRGETRVVAQEAIRRQGLVPPDKIGEHALQAVTDDVDRVLDRYLAVIADQGPRTVRAEADLGDVAPREVRVPDVFGTRIARVTFAKVKAKQALGILPELLALAAARPDQQWSAHVEALGGCVELAAPPAHRAHQILLDLFEVAAAALREPCPITAETGLAYATARAGGDSEQAEQAAAAAWAKDRERGSFAMTQLLGADAPFRALLADPPRPHERIAGEATRFGALAVRIYGPLLALDPKCGIREWPKGER